MDASNGRLLIHVTASVPTTWPAAELDLMDCIRVHVAETRRLWPLQAGRIVVFWRSSDLLHSATWCWRPRPRTISALASTPLTEGARSRMFASIIIKISINDY